MIAIQDETKRNLVGALYAFRGVGGANRLPFIDSLIAELENAATVPDPALIRAVYEADCKGPVMMHGVTEEMSNALAALYRAAGLVKGVEATA